MRNYELARRMPKPEHVRGLAAALEVMSEALTPFDDAADHNELFLMTVELADAYGFEFGYNDDFAYIAPTRDFFIQGIGRWAKAYAAMCKNEEAFRDDYELWKDEFHNHFSKRDYRRLPRLRSYEARFGAALDKRTLRRRPQGHAPHPWP